ncbi:hypothetical protein HGRIS_002050 [Hohenbuehelia grisea]|uniref:PEBP-like protein n=1 Tax=Hohenbuehelia grisea TaxID=104357 RepID=A0ABR3JJA7_9AGAR
MNSCTSIASRCFFRTGIFVVRKSGFKNVSPRALRGNIYFSTFKAIGFEFQTMHIASLSVLLFCSFALAQSSNATTNARDAFRRAQIVPEIIPSFSPIATLGVVFTVNSTKEQINVQPGMNLSVAQTALKPQFYLNTTSSSLLNDTFVLVMIDPDAPSPQNHTFSNVRHMLGGSFRVNGTTSAITNGTLLTNTTATITDFLAPGPLPGSDPHRYTILLYRQPSAFESNAAKLVNSTTTPLNWNLTAFASAVHLGNPVAGNFFFTKADDSANGTASGSQPSSTAPSGGSNGAFAAGVGWVQVFVTVAGLPYFWV